MFCFVFIAFADELEQKSCAFSRSGKLVVCAGSSGRVSVFSVDSLTRLFRTDKESPVTKLATSLVSDHVAAVSGSSVRVVREKKKKKNGISSNMGFVAVAID